MDDVCVDVPIVTVLDVCRVRKISDLAPVDWGSSKVDGGELESAGVIVVDSRRGRRN